MTKTVQQNRKLLRSKTISDVTKYQSKIGKYKQIPTEVDVEIPVLRTKNVQGRELGIKVGEYEATLTKGTLSSLTDKASHSSLNALLDKARIIATIPTEIKPLVGVACVGSDEAWVRGIHHKSISRFDIQGTVQGVVECQDRPFDITLTRQGEVVYSMNGNVKIVRNGKTEHLISTPWGWNPDGLCCTRSGDILVSMSHLFCTYRKIVRYHDHIVKQEIDRDVNGQPIYKGGENILLVTENNNGDICASDNNAKMVIAVDKSGRVQFQYDGAPAWRGEQFDPGHLVTDSMSQIIVADNFNSCLHILDQNGQFLRCVDDCGLDNPIGLSVDSKGRLWVGLCDSGKVKVIQYLKYNLVHVQTTDALPNIFYSFLNL
jgi:hypothetical protein